MKLIFGMMILVSLSHAETSPPGGSHASPGKGLPPQPAYPSQAAPKQDPFVRLNALVNACLVPQGNASRNANLGRSGR
jgi:hypothetical protein